MVKYSEGVEGNAEIGRGDGGEAHLGTPLSLPALINLFSMTGM